MASFIAQYKILFFFSWVVLYLIFPAWALPISVTARASVFFGLILFFFASANLMNRWFNALDVNKPVIVKPADWPGNIKDNLFLVIICCIAAILHIRYLFLPVLIIGDETIHLTNGLWIYQYIESSRHSFIQIIFWVFISLLILLRKKINRDNSILSWLNNNLIGSTRDNFLKYPFILLIIGFLVAYFLLLKDIAYFPVLIRYPPVSKSLYLMLYSAFGINQIFPRVMQLIFYLLCSVYLYRTINLFYEKRTALLGASIYLFLPVSFAYAYLAEIESGVIFFIVAVSFYFLRFLKYQDNRDFLLCTYLIGIGFLYKDPVFLVFPVCLMFIIFYIFNKYTFCSFLHLKILMLSAVTVAPWMIITKFFSWRNYTFVLSNLTSLNGKIVTYLSMMSSNLSLIVFIPFVLSVLYVCFIKRSMLTIFFGLLFVVYYFFIVSDMGLLSPRFSMAFYPTVAVFISTFIARIMQHLKWRHASNIFFVAITTYLIIISTVPSFGNRFLAIENKKLHYYPSKEAMKWVSENIKDGEKVLTIRILSSKFYRYKYSINPDKMIDIMYEMEKVFTPEKLREFYKEHDISYIVFPYSAEYVRDNSDAGILEYLKNNMKKEFTEVAKYNLNENFIYIYKTNR